MTRRETFLRTFLGALGAWDVIVSRVTRDCVEGIVVYDPEDPEERQEFRWHVSEDKAPGTDVLLLATLLRDHRLLDIDRILVSRAELRDLYIHAHGMLSEASFAEILDELESVQIRMVDEGEETDAFFIHE